MVKISPSKFEKGMYIKFKEESFRIISIKFHNPGRGSAFYQTRLKNIKTNNQLEHTFKHGETVDQIDVSIIEMQYLYKQDKTHIFMDKKSFEQITLTKSLVGKHNKFLKEGRAYQIIVHDNNPIGIKLPKKLNLEVVQAENAVKGNTATGAKKRIKLETGIEILAPLFIKRGDVVSVNTDTEQYLERVKKDL